MKVTFYKNDLNYGVLFLHKGMRIWEANIKERTLRDVTDETEEVFAGIKQIEIQPDCMYIRAINFKNATRKFEKTIQKVADAPIVDPKIIK